MHLRAAGGFDPETFQLFMTYHEQAHVQSDAACCGMTLALLACCGTMLALLACWLTRLPAKQALTLQRYSLVAYHMQARALVGEARHGVMLALPARWRMRVASQAASTIIP